MVFTVRNFVLILLLSGWNILAFPSFEPFTNATASGGTAYAAGSALYHQTNAFGEGWALWNGGNSLGEVTCAATGLTYTGFPAGFPLPSATSASLPGTNAAVAGYSAALQFSRATSVDTNNLVVHKVYASFLMQIPNLGSMNGGSPIYFGGFATNSGDESMALPSRAMKLFLKGNGSAAGTSTSYSLGIQTANGTGPAAYYDGGGHTAGSVLFVVMDYEFGINGQPDVGNLWVNPPATSFGTSVPATPTATFSTSTAGAQLVSAADFFLLARSGATLWGSLLVSDFSAGDTWSFVTGAPEIITPPGSQTNAVGTAVQFVVNAVAGATNVNPLVYQWQFNGQNLSDGGNVSGSATPVLTLANLDATNAGTYTIIVNNSLAAVSNSAVLTISGVSIITNIANQAVAPGGTVTFAVAAAGAPPLGYQWQENGTNLSNGVAASGMTVSGSQTPVLTLSNVGYGDNGDIFGCIITNSQGVSAVSASAVLSVGDPIFVSSPQNVTTNYGGTANFTVTVAGSAPFTYQWQHGTVNLTDGPSASGSMISGSSTPNLVITGLGYGDAGSYSVAVSNAHGVGAHSSSAMLTVENTNITTQMDERNVRAYGATGNGVTDDTAAFLNAIAAAQSAGNCGVYVPMGKYVISQTLTLNGIELVGKFVGGWPSSTAAMPTLLIRQYTSPALALLAGASLHGVAIDYDQGTPTTTNAPAISLQGIGITLSSLRIQNPYDAINTLGSATPGRARFSDILILQPAHGGVQISRCYDFVQYRHIEVLCNAAMSTGPAFSFGRVDEGGYVGLVASNCATGMEFLNDASINPAGGDFTGSFAACSMIECGTGVTVNGDHKIKISGGDFTSYNYGMQIDGTNAEVIITGGNWEADNDQAIIATLAGNIIFDHNTFSRSGPAANPLVWIQNCTTVTVNHNQFLPGSTGLELDSQVQRAIVYGNSFEDGGITNNTTSGLTAIAANMFTASPPPGLTATAGNGQVTLNWIAPLGATSYEIQRSLTNGGPYTNLASVTGTNYTDTGLSNGTAYYYVLIALRGTSQSALSAQVSATPQIPPPVPPASLTATPGNGQVALTWTASPGATNYNVDESLVSGGPYATVASLAGTNDTVTGLTNGITYYYVVSAVNIGGAGTNSSEVAATPQIPPPVTPTSLAGTATNGAAILNWNGSAWATSYYVKRALSSGGPYAIIAEPSSPDWTDLIVANGTQYFYVVSGVNEAGQSPNSSQVEVMPQLFPSLGVAAASGNNSLTLSWPDSATNYSVFMATNLALAAQWFPVTNAIQSSNGIFYLTLPVTNVGQQFYRLVAP